MLFDGNVLNGNKGIEGDLKGSSIAPHTVTNLTEIVSKTNICLTVLVSICPHPRRF